MKATCYHIAFIVENLYREDFSCHRHLTVKQVILGDRVMFYILHYLDYRGTRGKG